MDLRVRLVFMGTAYTRASLDLPRFAWPPRHASPVRWSNEWPVTADTASYSSAIPPESPPPKCNHTTVRTARASDSSASAEPLADSWTAPPTTPPITREHIHDDQVVRVDVVVVGSELCGG